MLQNNKVLEMIQDTLISAYLKMSSDNASIKWQSNHQCMTSNNNLNETRSKNVLPYIWILIPSTALHCLTYLSLAELRFASYFRSSMTGDTDTNESKVSLNLILFLQSLTCILLHSRTIIKWLSFQLTILDSYDIFISVFNIDQEYILSLCILHKYENVIVH